MSSRESIVKSLLKPRNQVPKQYQYLFDQSVVGDIPFPICDFHISPNRKNLVTHFSVHNFDKISTSAKTTTPTVLLHGLNGSRLLYQDMISIVETYYPTIPLVALDLFGHGLSSCPKNDYSLKFFIEQILSLLAHLRVPESAKINLVGFSLGGAVAVGFASKVPQRINKLVLISPAGFVPVKSGKNKSTTETQPLMSKEEDMQSPNQSPAHPSEEPPITAGVSKHVKLIKYIPSFILNPIARYLFKTSFKHPPMLPPDLPPDQVEENQLIIERLLWQTFVKKNSIEATISIVKYFPLFDMTKEYTKLGESDVGRLRPVLLIWGEKDRVNPVNLVSGKIKSFFQNSYLLTVPNAGHVVINEQPTVAISSIISFLQSNDDLWYPALSN